MKRPNLLSARKCSIVLAVSCLLGPRIWGQTTIAGGNNASPDAAVSATRDSKANTHPMAVYLVTKDVFHQKANELNEAVSAGNKETANSKFNETLALMNSYLAYLDEQIEKAGANDKTKWNTRMTKAKEAYFDIISYHNDLHGNKAGLNTKLNDFEKAIN